MYARQADVIGNIYLSDEKTLKREISAGFFNFV